MQKINYTLRSDGRYMCRLYVGKDEKGKNKYITLYAKTQKELKTKYIEAVSKREKGVDLSSQSTPFSVWADEYLALKKTNGSHNYIACIKSQLKHLKPLDNMPISKIRPANVQSILVNLATRKEKPLARKTLNDVRNTAYNVFRLAVNNRVIDFNPVEAVETPTGTGKTRREAIDSDQIKWIAETDELPEAQVAAMIMLYAGLRRGELLALTWTDIDLTNKTIRVNKSVNFIDNKPVVKPMTKTEAGMRLISIPDVLADFLKTVKRKSLIVCTRNGEMMTQSGFRRMWESYMSILNEKYGDFRADKDTKKKNGERKSRLAPGGLPTKISEFTPHQLRHTYASLLYKAGVDVLTAKDQLGHSDIKTTLNIYTHLDSIYKQHNMSKLNGYLNGQNQGEERESI